jgi:hypothetical protein
MRLTKLKATAMVYLATQAPNDAKLGAVLRDRLINIQTAMQTANIAPTAGPVFIFHGYDPVKPVDMEIAYPVADGTLAVPGLQVGQLDSTLAATAIYTGPLAQEGSYIGRLYGQLKTAGHVPTDVIRERSLYFEDEDSPNNIVLFEIPLQN